MSKRKNESEVYMQTTPPEKRNSCADIADDADRHEDISDNLNTSMDMFNEDDSFEDLILSLPDAVLCGSQTVPDIVLPDHILEIIFSSLPVTEMLSCAAVCKRWNEIIFNPQFLPSKILYHKARCRDRETIENVTILMKANEILIPDTQFIINNLIRYMSFLSGRTLTNCEIKSLNIQLEKHPNFEVSNVLLNKKIIEHVKSLDSPVSKFWMLCTTITLLSSEVYEVSSLHQIMAAVLKLPLVMEFFYHLALCCWILYREKLLSQEYHYRVFCVISNIENISTQLPSNECSFPLTHEQIRVVSHNFQSGDLVRVMAYAGTGKTSTLIACVKSKPHLKFLYTSFSKAVVDQGKEVFKFTPNVTCETIHSLAYRRLQMNNFRYKLARGSLRAYYIQQILEIEEEKNKFSRQVVFTLTNFMASASHGLSLSHVPRTAKVKEKTEDGEVWAWRDISEADRQFILGLARRFWMLSADLENNKCHMIDDCYVKMWQMSQPVICGYDIIMLDEAQDCSECMRDLIERQRHCALLFVGDSHQQIYGFRKARDALLRITPTHTYYLTQGFRFGTKIAQVADCVLQIFKYNDKEMKSADKTLLGVGPPGTLDGSIHDKKCAILCRTNLGVIQQVILKLREEKESGKTIGVVGGTDKMGLDSLLEVFALAKNLTGSERKKIGLPYYPGKAFQRYKNIKQLRDEAEANEDNDMTMKLHILTTYGNDLPKVIEHLKKDTLDWKNADYIVSTVHKAKGLEFETVLLCDDFASHLVKHMGSSNLSSHYKEEANLVYVAATRATRSLILYPALHSVLKYGNINFYRPSLTSKSVGKIETFCVHCKQVIDNTTIITFQQTSIKKIQVPGCVCPRCFNILNPAWGNMLGSPEQIESGLIQDDLLYGVQHPSV